MSLRPPLWMQTSTGLPQYNAIDDRALIAATAQPGVCGAGDLAVTQRAEGTNLSVDVAPGSCIVAGTNTAQQGNYLCRAISKVNVPLAGSPPSGQSRIDLIVAQVRDGEIISGPSDWIIGAVTGTPSSNPTVPATPASALVLARVTVGPQVTTITNANITDQRSASGNRLVSQSIKAGYGIPWVNNAAGGWMTMTGGTGSLLYVGGFRGPGIVLAWYTGMFHPITGGVIMQTDIGLSINGGWGTTDVVRGGSASQYAENPIAVHTISSFFARAGTITGNVVAGVAYGTGNVNVWSEGSLIVVVIPTG